MKYKFLFLIGFLIAFGSLQIFAQQLFLKGTVKDIGSHLPLIGATVQLKIPGDEKVLGAITDTYGLFTFTNLSKRPDYEIIISYLGYNTYRKSIKLQDKNLDLGNIFLSEKLSKIKEVEITGQSVRAEQIEDTLQLNADAYKVNPDASAEDLVKKMPGITVENGQVKAQGENVQKVYVDGKPFFDQDPTLTMRNLPAEIVDKIQIFDEQSEQARFTGFNDGQTSKTINIITKSNMRNGQFGKLYAGYGNEERYYAGGNINIFKGNSRVSLIGLSNNVNQQNFSSQDLLGLTGTSQRRGGGGFRGGMQGGGGRGTDGGQSPRGGGETSNFLVGQQAGIATTHALGVNYSDKWGENINVSGSYFINYSNNETDEANFQDYYTSDETSRFYDEQNNSKTNNLNHRFNFRFDYNLDSLNSLMIRPRISIQQNNSKSMTFGQSMEDYILISQTDNRNSSDRLGLNFSNDILFMHRFMKPGRTVSVNFSTGVNNRDGESNRFADNRYNMNIFTVSDSLDQLTYIPTKGYSVSSRLAYTEPAGKNSQVQINYNTSLSWNNSDRETFNFNRLTNQYDLPDTTLSNIFKSLYVAHQFGPGYRYRKDKFMFTLGINYEYASLRNNQKFPNQMSMNHYFTSIQPNAMLMYNISQTKNLRLFYRTNSNAPSIDQLQNVLDNSNPLQLSSGNPDLKQAFQQNLFLRYSATNAQKTSVFFCMLGFSNTSNYIANYNILASNDTILAGNIFLPRGVQFRQPVNIDGYWNFRFFTTFGFPIKPLKSNLNFNTSYIYTKTPGIINGIKNYSDNNSIGLGVVLSSNISPGIDFTLSSNSNYNIAQSTVQSDFNNSYFSQFTNFTINLIFLKNLTFQSNIGQQYYNGLSQDYDLNYILWNLSLGKKILKNQRGEFKLSVFDVLNQNSNVRRNVTELYIEDTQSNVLQRYAILTFTYNLRHFGIKGNSAPEEERRQPQGEPLFRPF